MVALSGLSIVTLAALGASAAGPTAELDVPQAAVSPTLLTDLSALDPAQIEELDDLRAEREAALDQASRGTDRAAVAVAPPVAPAAPAVPATIPAFTEIAVNVRADASEDAPVVTTLEPGAELGVTGTVEAGYAEVVLEGQRAWVWATYLADAPPAVAEESDEPAAGGSVSGAPCAAGSSVESGLTANAVSVYRAVCARWPELSSYGGVGGSGEHAAGRALDIMISSDTGTAIAEFVRANAGALGVSEVIWRQRIWTTQRAGEGWRWMEDRGSSTANHYDHVHVTVH